VTAVASSLYVRRCSGRYLACS